MYRLIKPLLWKIDAEKTHHITLNALQWAYRCRLLPVMIGRSPTGLPTSLMGISVPNAVGLAAGLDKNGAYIDALAALGFGFIEIGTVTPRPQSGNPQPRLFRIPEYQAIINRMGFNNQGIDAVIKNIQHSRYTGVLGINIGKNATTPMEQAAQDYLICLEKAYPYAHYITINISSPNTKNLRNLQTQDELYALLTCLKNKQAQLSQQHQRYVPLAVKIAPDLDDQQLEAIAQVALKTKIDGIIATNTTIHKNILGTHPLAQQAGGLSGRPLYESSNIILHRLTQLLAGEIPVIGVGGITQGRDAQQKIAMGATAIQLYSGLIFQGPRLVHDCIRALAS